MFCRAQFCMLSLLLPVFTPPGHSQSFVFCVVQMSFVSKFQHIQVFGGGEEGGGGVHIDYNASIGQFGTPTMVLIELSSHRHKPRIKHKYKIYIAGRTRVGGWVSMDVQCEGEGDTPVSTQGKPMRVPCTCLQLQYTSTRTLVKTSLMMPDLSSSSTCSCVRDIPPPHPSPPLSNVPFLILTV